MIHPPSMTTLRTFMSCFSSLRIDLFLEVFSSKIYNILLYPSLYFKFKFILSFFISSSLYLKFRLLLSESYELSLFKPSFHSTFNFSLNINGQSRSSLSMSFNSLSLNLFLPKFILSVMAISFIKGFLRIYFVLNPPLLLSKPIEEPNPLLLFFKS